MASRCGASRGASSTTAQSTLPTCHDSEHLRHHPGQQIHAVGTRPGLVTGGKMAAEVTEPSRPEKGVGHGVGDDIGVAMADEARSVEVDAAEDETTGRGRR